MTNIQGLISALRPDELAMLQQGGPDQILDRSMVDALDRAAGGPGEGRGYYVVHGSLEPVELRNYYLREDVAAAVLATAALEDAIGDGG
ncbi:hypothetical protein [Arthrobacter cavernae]|uniref:Uncharacterized protein n=1 Tax=Arthrobacter cavernae TaxID=2817681 RepID=A0A939HFZ6_9MICC|nr:hypothetical protein [Arthrobacter cavernae]MBO1269211.1 hypothetical protein [Arthrobacter cavernae]